MDPEGTQVLNPFAPLPDELILEIFEHLALPSHSIYTGEYCSTFFSLCLTCQYLHPIALRFLLYKISCIVRAGEVWLLTSVFPDQFDAVVRCLTLTGRDGVQLARKFGSRCQESGILEEAVKAKLWEVSDSEDSEPDPDFDYF
jgi:hypothetical protein